MNGSEYLGVLGGQFLAFLPGLLFDVAALIVLVVRRSRAPRPATIAIGCILGMLALNLLFLFVYPAIVASDSRPSQLGLMIGTLSVVRSVVYGALFVGIAVAVVLDRPAPQPTTWPGQYPPAGSPHPADGTGYPSYQYPPPGSQPPTVQPPTDQPPADGTGGAGRE